MITSECRVSRVASQGPLTQSQFLDSRRQPVDLSYPLCRACGIHGSNVGSAPRRAHENPGLFRIRFRPTGGKHFRESIKRPTSHPLPHDHQQPPRMNSPFHEGLARKALSRKRQRLSR